MLFRTYGQAVLIMHKRHPRVLIAVGPPDKAADPIARAIRTIRAPLPPQWRQTVTFDDGAEFARHHQLPALGIETFFCDTHAPWQKGGVENAFGRLRRTSPRNTPLVDLPDNPFTRLVRAYNNTPGKCLGYQTPAETFSNHVLRFKRESTLRPPSTLLCQGEGGAAAGEVPSDGAEDRAGQVPLQRPQGFAAALALAQPALQVARCSAAFSCRLPRRSSRWRTCVPLDASRGATPQNRA